MADPNQQRPKPPIVPQDYAGKWIAWSHDLTRIVASGETYAQSRQAANDAGEPKAYLTKAPEARGSMRNRRLTAEATTSVDDGIQSTLILPDEG